MRSIVALAVLLATSPVAAGDLEHPRPVPCTCMPARPLVDVARLDAGKPDEHAGYVASRLRHTHESNFAGCLRDGDRVDVIVRYKRGAQLPKLRFVGSRRVSSCLTKLHWLPMIAAPRDVTYRFRITPARR